MSTLELEGRFEGIDDLEDQKHDLEEQEQQGGSEDEDEEDDDDLTPPARQQESAYEKAILQLSSSMGIGSATPSNRNQTRDTQSTSTATASSPLPVVGRQRQGSIDFDSLEQGSVSHSPRFRPPQLAGSPSTSPSAAAIAARIVTSRARTSSNPLARPSSWASGSPTQGHFSLASPTSPYATQSAADFSEPGGSGQSPSNKSDFATYMQQTQVGRRLSLDRRHSYSAHRLASPSPGEFTASLDSPPLSTGIHASQQDSPKARPVDADEAWVDLSIPQSKSRAVEVEPSNSHSSHARTVSDPFPGLYALQAPQNNEAAAQSPSPSRSSRSSDILQAPSASASPGISAVPSPKARSKSAGMQKAQSPHRSSFFPPRSDSSISQSADTAVALGQSSTRAPASPRTPIIQRPSLLRQHSSPTKSASTSRSSLWVEPSLAPSSSPQDASTPGSHKRSPSLGGNADTVRSLSPSGALGGRLAFLPRSPNSLPGISDLSAAPTQQERSSQDISSPSFASPGRLEGGLTHVLPAESSPPLGLALSSLQSFKFGGASPSRDPTRDRTPSPPFLPSLSLSGDDPLPTIADNNEQELLQASSRPSGNPDLALPPPSGYELSDDLDLDVSPFDEHSDDTDMFGPFPGLPTRYDSLADMSVVSEDADPQHSEQTGYSSTADEAPPSPLMSSIPLPLFDAAHGSPSQSDAKSPEWGVALDYNKRESLEGRWEEDTKMSPHMHTDVEAAIDEEALTPLERIFLFAKSEVVEHRETVSRALPRWIIGVEICEAVDYVLPLFEGLACDEDLVKEAFATSLDSLVYHFLSNCPLQEMDASHQIARLDSSPAHAEALEARLDEAAEAGVSTSLVVTQQGLELVETPELANSNDESSRQQELLRASQGWPDDTKTITPGTGSTMRSSEDGTAADLLSGDLPKGQPETVPRPHISFTVFHEVFGLLLLNDSSVISSLAQEAIARLMLRIDGRPVPNDGLDLHVAAGAEQPDDLQPEVVSVRTHEHSPYEFTQEARSIVKKDILGNLIGTIANIDVNSPPQLARLLGGRSSTGSSQVQTPAPEVKDTDAAAQISSFFSTSSSPHPSHHGSDPHVLDARQGRFVALSCLNLLIDSEAVSADLQAEYLLPIAINGARDSDAMIRMAAVDALAGLAKMAEQAALAEQILPAFEDASRDDNIQVRRAVCGSFQEVVQALQDQAVVRQVTVNIASALYRDDVAQVRQGILEVIGPLIHLFVGDVPEELMRIFEGSSSSEEATKLDQQQPQESAEPFQPLVPAFAVAELTQTQARTPGSDWDVSKDHERAIITAYNLPGVLLSLGSDGWPRLRSLHKRLATEALTSQARYLIASSIHDIAKLIGPEDTTADLLPMLPKLAQDDDAEVSDRLFERLGPLVDCLSLEGLPTYIRLICDWWDSTTSRNWQRRELLAEAVAQMSTRLENNQGLYSAFIYLLKQILRDSIACVRAWGMQSLSVAIACGDPDLVDQLRTIWEGLAADTHHKYRSLCANAVALVSSTVALEQSFLLDLLVDLANDSVPDVRIGVARAFRFLCMTGGPYDLERPSRLQAALVRLATSDDTAIVRELLVDVRLDPLPDDFGPDDIGEDASFSSSDEEDASDAAQGTQLTGRNSNSRPIPFTQTSDPQGDTSQGIASPPVDTWNLADLAGPVSRTHSSSETSYTSFDSLLPRPYESLSSAVTSPQRGDSGEASPSGNSRSPVARRLFTPSTSPLSHDTRRTPEQQPWHLSMRDVDQFVAIDLAV